MAVMHVDDGDEDAREGEGGAEGGRAVVLAGAARPWRPLKLVSIWRGIV